MKRFNNLKIKTKLLSSFIFIALILLVVSWSGYQGSTKNKSNTQELKESMLQVSDMANANISLLIARADVLAIICANDPEQKDKYKAEIINETKKVNEIIENFGKSNLEDKEREVFNKFMEGWKTYVPLRDEAVELAMQMKNEEALKILYGPAFAPLVQSRSSLRSLADMNVNSANETQQSSLSEANSTQTQILIFMIIGVLTSIIFGIFISSLLSKPLKKLSESADAVAGGNFDIELESDSRDEIGALSNSLSIMVENIKGKIDNLNNLPVPVMQVDTEYNIQFMNKFGADLLMTDQKTLVGKKCYDYFKTEHCNTEKCSCFQAMKLNKNVTEETVSRANGGRMDIMYTGSPIKDKNGKIVGALEYISNITELKDMQNYLTRSTATIETAMGKFAEGDLTVRVTPERTDDGIGKLFNAFNSAIEKIKSMLVSVMEAVNQTASASTQISASAEEMAAGASEQSNQTTEVAGAVEEMTKTILETSRNSSSANDAAKKSGLIAREGGKVVNETIEGMNRIAGVVKKSAETVQALGKSSNEIGEIIQVIDDIADQTNLLALNAAIEAARAGEQGRGFAVVADEVRKLAERTTKATKEIAKMIKQIQKETEGAVISMNEGTEEVDKGKVLADKAGQSLKQIIADAQEVVDIVTQVAAASEEQSSAAEQISKNIEGINNVTRESAEGIQQIAKTSEDLSNLTIGLQELISKFKFQDNASNNSNEIEHHPYKGSVHNNSAKNRSRINMNN